MVGRRALTIYLALAALTLGIATTAPGARAEGRYFHTHIDSYSQGDNCGFSEWSSKMGFCYGHGWTNANAMPIGDQVALSWCDGSSLGAACLDKSHAALTLPDGYSRWLKVCRLYARSECRDYLIGAVKMPSGPFAVLAGSFDGKSIMPSDIDKPVESAGGPLFLHAGFHSNISIGTGRPSKKGYVFDLRGHLEFH